MAAAAADKSQKGFVPKEVRAPAPDREAYIAWRAATDLRGPYRVDPVFLRGTRRGPGPEAFDVGETPLIAFINAKSGGRVGPQLAEVLSRALGTSQVFDLSEVSPAHVLRALWRNLEEQEASGNPAAARVRENLRILVCGGDGTVAWLFKVVQELGLKPAPAIAIMPLGTGNDLSRSFNWGAAFLPRWIKGHASVYRTLKRIADAEVGNVDAWQIRVTVPGRGHQMPHTYALTELDPLIEFPVSPFAARHGHFSPAPSAGGAPPSVAGARGSDGGPITEAESTLATLGSVLGSGPSSASLGSAAPTPVNLGGGVSAGGASAAGTDDGYAALAYTGSFFNYFSIGGDAQAAHGFHTLRERRPGWAGSRMANMFWYSWFSCSSGWFCNTIPSVSRFSNVEVLKDGVWTPLTVPPAIKALVVVNLQSYGGGRNIWGEKMNPEKAKARGFVMPSVDDGMIELVGFTHGWQALSVMVSHARAAHAKRLAQGQGLRLTLRSDGPAGHTDKAYMQLDGEPWDQKIPVTADAPPVVVEIYHAGAARVLINTSDSTQRVRKMHEVLPPGKQEDYLRGSSGRRDSAGGAVPAAAAASTSAASAGASAGAGAGASAGASAAPAGAAAVTAPAAPAAAAPAAVAAAAVAAAAAAAPAAAAAQAGSKAHKRKGKKKAGPTEGVELAQRGGAPAPAPA